MRKGGRSEEQWVSRGFLFVKVMQTMMYRNSREVFGAVDND